MMHRMSRLVMPLAGVVRSRVTPVVMRAPLRMVPQKRDFFTIIEQYQRGVTFTLGRVTSVKGPGPRLQIPFIQEIAKIDIRTVVADLNKQEVITRDNVSISVDAIVYYRIVDAKIAVCSVEDIAKSVTDLAQVKVRELLSHSEVNQILHQREKFSSDIKESVKEMATEWGVEIVNVSLKDIKFDEGMSRAMAKKAEAERLREAKIIHADSEVQTAAKLLEAARVLEKSPAALRLRELDTLQQVAKETNHSTLFVPTSFMSGNVAQIMAYQDASTLTPATTGKRHAV
eukprot:TRINITY_DN294_c0_g1_i3.p1 TRINITY_DN294_c0_g1~~TRINITY_DN294_c0_g1_i3.p1  ORF type:complete len:302 (-),score=64.78 TRINITY_DN294_c0_g1_i3:143-1000(-)